MNATEIKTNHTKYNLQSWSKQKGLNPIAVEKGEGIYFWDYDGSRYTDMSSQLVNLNVGFGCRPIIDAIKEQAEKFCFVGPSYACESRSKLAEMVVDLMPDNIAKVFFTNGGADANENAIKMARMYTGRKKVFSRYRSYHGSTFGAGNLTGEPRRYPLEPGIPGFVKFFDPYMYATTSRSQARRSTASTTLTSSASRLSMKAPTRLLPSLWRPSPAPTASLSRRRATLRAYAGSATSSES